MSTMDEHLMGNKELVRRHFEEIFNKRRLEAADQLMADVFIENGVAPFQDRAPGLTNGPESIRRTAQWLLEAFPELHFDIQEMVAEGSVVAVRSIMRGTFVSSFMGLAPTGKRLKVTRTDIFRMSGGKLAEHWANRDDLEMLLQLGVVQPPPSKRDSASARYAGIVSPTRGTLARAQMRDGLPPPPPATSLSSLPVS